MPFFADAQDTAKHYGNYITEFQDLFRANDVGFGSPEDFFRLAPRLARDESFREGFTALTKSVAKREDGRLTLTRMLTIVALAMGGKGIEEVGDSGAVPVSLMVVFLAGIGGWSETEPSLNGVVAEGMAAAEALANQDDHVSQEKSDSSIPSAATEGTGGETTDEEREAKELEQRLAAGPEENIETLTTSLFGGPAQVKEALSRLEMNTLQMKMHLDSIDSRMERIEPHLDDLKSKLSTPPETAERLEPVPVPPMKPWPTETEEAPLPEWGDTAPPMRPWPSEKEQDLVWEPRPGDMGAKSPPRAAWPVKEAEPEWRAPMRESEPVRETFSSNGRTLAHGAAPLRMEPESRAAFDDDLSIRVPFDNYLEEEPRRGRRMAGALAGIVVMLVIVGGLLYSSQGWEGYRYAVHSVGGAFASGRAAVARWIASERAPASPAPSQAPANGAGETASSASPAPPAPTTNPPANLTTNPTTAATTSPSTQAPPASTQSASTQTTSAPPVTPPQAAQPSAPVPAAEDGSSQHNDEALASSAARAPETDRVVKSVGRPVVSVLAGSGAAASEEASPALPRGMTTSVPIFVDEARLSVVSNPAPDYPRDALARGVTGDVVVQAIVASNGEVESAQIVSGPPGLLKPSIDAAREWRFRPYVVHGKPTEVRTYIRFRYGTER